MRKLMTHCGCVNTLKSTSGRCLKMMPIVPIGIISFPNSTSVISTSLKAKMKNLRNHFLICLTLAGEAFSLESHFRQANESSGRIGDFHFLLFVNVFIQREIHEFDLKICFRNGVELIGFWRVCR